MTQAVAKKEVQKEAVPLKKSERKREKRKKQDHGAEIIEIIKIWEQFRRHDIDSEKRFMLIDKCLKLTKKFLHELCMSRDTAHLVQSMLQFGTEKQKWEIFSLLKGHISTLCFGRYSSHVVLKMLKVCGKSHIEDIITAVSSKMEKFMTHKHGSVVLEALYNEYCNAKNRKTMLKKIYSSFYAFDFQNTSLATLNDLIRLNEKNKKIILEKVCEFLQKCAEKGLLHNTLMQQIFYEYIREEVPYLCNPQETSKDFKIPDRLSTLISSIIEVQQLVPMLNTGQGVKVAIYLLICSSTKLRRQLVKLLKTFVSATACHEKGYLFIIAILDCVDDIVLVKKSVIAELVEDLETLIVHPVGRKVLLYCLCNRNTKHLSKQLLDDVLSVSDRSPYTKKGLAERALELRSPSIFLLPKLLDTISEDLERIYVGNRVENLDPIRDRGRQILMMEIINRSSPKELTLEYCKTAYKRTIESEAQPDATNPVAEHGDIINNFDLGLIKDKRDKAIQKFVERVLAVEFNASTDSTVTGQEDKSHVDLNRQRKKRAIAIAEDELAKKKKIKVDPFTNMNSKKLASDEAEPMDCDEPESDKKKKEVDVEKQKALTKEEEALVEIPWLERPEAGIVMKGFLETAKKLKDYTIFDEIIKSVPTSQIKAWTQSNRSCFLLVKLLDCGYEKMVKFIKNAIDTNSIKSSLANSEVPGQEVLYKKLTQ